MANYTFDQNLLAAIGKLSKHQRHLALKELGKLEWQRCAEDIFYWIDEKRHPAMPYVYTQDYYPQYTCNICNDGNTYAVKHRKVHLKVVHKIETQTTLEVMKFFKEIPAVRPFPLEEYMPPIIEAWLNEQYVFIQKSRDMKATWLTVAMYTWDALFHEGRQHIFQSEDARKTSDLVKRAWIIYKHQPKFIRQIHLAHPSMGIAKAGVLRIDTLNSEIMGFPQGADQIRQYHPSGVFLDEAAYLVEAGPTFTAVKPAIESGGKFTAVSSANPSWFWKACIDELD